MSSGQDWKLVPFKDSVAVGRLSITSRQQSLLLLQQRQNAFSKCCLFHSFTPVSPSSASERLTVHTFFVVQPFHYFKAGTAVVIWALPRPQDRKSTRLNSSH